MRKFTIRVPMEVQGEDYFGATTGRYHLEVTLEADSADVAIEHVAKCLHAALREVPGPQPLVRVRR